MIVVCGHSILVLPDLEPEGPPPPLWVVILALVMVGVALGVLVWAVVTTW